MLFCIGLNKKIKAENEMGQKKIIQEFLHKHILPIRKYKNCNFL